MSYTASYTGNTTIGGLTLGSTLNPSSDIYVKEIDLQMHTGNSTSYIMSITLNGVTSNSVTIPGGSTFVTATFTFATPVLLRANTETSWATNTCPSSYGWVGQWYGSAASMTAGGVTVYQGNTGNGSYSMNLVFDLVKKCLFQDGTDLKIFSSGAWQTVGTAPATELLFQNNGMTDLSAVNNAALQQLTNSKPQLLTYTTDASPHTSTLKAVPGAKFMAANSDIYLGSITAITASSVTASTKANAAGNGAVLLLASADKGATWQAWNGSAWIAVDTSNLANIKANGMTPVVFNALTQAAWSSLIPAVSAAAPQPGVRFGYYLEQDASTDVMNVDTLTLTFNMMGSWDMGVPGTDYTYDYTSEINLEVSLLANGDYKINA